MATNTDLAQADGAVASEAPSATPPVDREKVLPLPSWLVKVYFIFPVVLYIPDVIFNYFVYSDGLQSQNQNALIQASQMALWAFLSIGVVGMAYLLSVLAPWHWGQGHHMQAIFCGVGVIIATAITTWNSLSFRSTIFHDFPTDQWAYEFFPQLAAQRISLTMVLIALAPPFWGLFWALVQPTQTGRSLRQLQEGHAEKLMRVQHESELKRLRAEANAKVREAQLKGMAQTAAAARQQTAALFAQRRGREGQPEGDKAESGEQPALPAASAAPQTTPASQPAASGEPGNILQMPRFVATRPRETGTGRNAAMMNEAAPTSAPHAAPAKGAMAAQAPLMSEAGLPAPATGANAWGVAKQTTPGYAPDVMEFDGMTGTTGPRPAVRRAAEPSPLLRAMNEPSPVYVKAVTDAYTELSAGGKKPTQKEWIARVAEKLNVDESAAKAIFNRVRESQRAAKA